MSPPNTREPPTTSRLLTGSGCLVTRLKINQSEREASYKDIGQSEASYMDIGQSEASYTDIGLSETSTSYTDIGRSEASITCGSPPCA